MMAVPTKLASLVGQWQGSNRLWLDPAEPASESAATAVLKLLTQGKICTLGYTWADEGQPQDGFLMLSQTKQNLIATWIDSWHMSDQIMLLTGTVEADGTLWVQGAYPAPPGPDWGWRISILSDSPDQFRLIMHNVTPDGDEMLAVEAAFSRA